MKKITQQELHNFSEYVYKISGIHLDETKGYLLESRLNPLLVSYNLDSYEELLRKAITDKTKDLQEHIINAVSTNETFFFRDKSPFTILQYKLIPELIDRRQKLYRSKQIPIRILSAACSTGQEVYSIAISLLEEIPNIQNYDINILGVDIADEVIAKASYGKYGKFEVERGMSPALLNKYFNRHDDGWRIKDQVRVLANFKKVNLLENFANIGYFDIIFCRNVAIYFKHHDKVKLFKKLASILEPDGALIVGGSESLTGVAPDFQVNHYLKGIYYTLKEGSAEKSKEVKKFEVHTFAGHTVEEKPKVVKKIIRTIRYINSDEEGNPSARPNFQGQKTQDALEELKRKRLEMSQKSEDFNRGKGSPGHQENKNEQEPDLKNNTQTERSDIQSAPVTQSQKKTLQEVMNTKQQGSTQSLLGSISNKYENTRVLNIQARSAGAGQSLLSRITNK
ncbi:MAG: protein-glutamate O-methyltransferase CheR [Candidatus Marinimicrobia bacterium]|nr:protein-glutamate O-methyltransferase CheR [Candidatus Neomarinimicrobiota bacterium]